MSTLKSKPSAISKPLASPKSGVLQKNKRVKGTPPVRTLKISNTHHPTTGQLVLARVTGLQRGVDNKKVLSKVKKGLSFNAIKILEEAYRMTQKEIATILSIPVSTLNRRKATGKLHPDESDRIVRFAKLKDDALAMMQSDEDAAIAWLQTSLPILNGESPMEHASTELGAREVEDLIGRIRHGVFS